MMLYENQELSIELLGKYSAGHIRITPKQEASDLDELPDKTVIDLLSTANTMAALLFQLIKAQGTNIICHQVDNKIVVDVIDREQDDKLDLMWQPSPPKTNLDEIKSRISGAFLMGDDSVNTPTDDDNNNEDDDNLSQEDSASISSDETEEDYLVKQLERLP